MLFNQYRAQEFMRQCHLDALVATSPVNIAYLSDYHCWLDTKFKEYMENPGAPSDLKQAYAVYPLEGKPALVVNPIFAVNAADIWIKDLHFFGDPGFDRSIKADTPTEDYDWFFKFILGNASGASPTKAVLHILQQRGLSTGRIGIEMEGLPIQRREELARSLPRAEIKDCSNLLRVIRMVKSAEELARLKRSAEINEMAAMESLSLARSGQSVRELAHHFRKRVAELDAEFDHFDFGIRGMGITTESNYILCDDDVLYVDFGCIFQHYFSDSGTTLALGDLPPALQQRHDALRACFTATVAEIKPGTRASAVRGAMWQALKERNVTSSFPHGHGLGMEVRDYPILVADNGLRIRDECIDVASDLMLEPQMVINIEAAFFLPGTGSVHMEKSFVVTSEGCSALVPQDRSAPVRPESTLR